MRRPFLVSTLVLGILIAVLGASGTWATFDDTARSEEITVDSFEYVEPEPVDLRIADALADGTCPTDVAAYRDGNEGFAPIHLEYNRDGRSDGLTRQEALAVDLCVRSFGTARVSVNLVTEVLVDDDPYCSEQEEDVPGETCGLTFSDRLPTPGELDDAYTITLSYFADGGTRDAACQGRTLAATIADLRDGIAAELAVVHTGVADQCRAGWLLPGTAASFHLSLAYDPGFGGRDATAVARVAQTDTLTFRSVLGATAG